jgi:hypothetical protein
MDAGPVVTIVEARPGAITVVSVFLFIATGIAFVVGVSLLFPNPIMNWLWKLNRPAEGAFRAMGRDSGVPLLLLGVGTFAAAKGLLQRKRWAWWFAVVLFGVNGIGDVVSFIVTGDWLRSASGVLIALAFLWALSRASVRRYFRL